MLFKKVFSRQETRKFGYTPYYYKEEQDELDRERIKFRRIRGGMSVSSKSVRSMIFLALLVLTLIAYFWDMVGRETRTFEIEDIKIEESQ